MEFRHLRYFIAVAENLHFGRAAHQLHISQPPLSQQIREMEEELGVKLFLRTKRRVELTEAGSVFLKEARLILAHTSHAVRSVQRSNRGEIGRLIIGFVMSATCSILPKILRVYRERFPEVELVLEEMTTGQGIDHLKERRLHLCFLRLPVREEELMVETVLREPLVLALPNGHPLTPRNRISLLLLADEPFVLFPRLHGPSFHDQIVSVCHGAGFSPNVVQEACQMQTILSLVAAGIGVSLIPASVQSLRSEGVQYRPLRERTPDTGLAIAWRRNETSPALERFINVVRETAHTRASAASEGRSA
jgi:DNA-binding transcriptional LysR family regulator